MIPNPWFILAGVLLVLALVTGAGVKGHSMGVDAQKVADQIEFNKINAERAIQKAEAAALMQKAQSDIITLQNARDTFKTNLEKQREQDRQATAALTAKYNGLQLRYAAAQNTTNRPNRDGTMPSTPDTPGAASPAILVLPDAVTGRLRSLATDGDTLRDDYAKCYRYATQVK